MKIRTNVITAEPVYEERRLSGTDRAIYRTLNEVADKIDKVYDCAHCTKANTCKEGRHCYKDFDKSKKYRFRVGR